VSFGAPAHEVDDFNLVAVADLGGFERRPLQYHQIVFDGDPPRIDVERREQLADGHGAFHFEGLAIENDLQRSLTLGCRPETATLSFHVAKGQNEIADREIGLEFHRQTTYVG